MLPESHPAPAHPRSARRPIVGVGRTRDPGDSCAIKTRSPLIPPSSDPPLPTATGIRPENRIVVIESISERERIERQKRAPITYTGMALRWSIRLVPAFLLLALLGVLLARLGLRPFVQQ